MSINLDIFYTAFLAISFIIALYDFLFFKIPNTLVLSLLGLYVIKFIVTGHFGDVWDPLIVLSVTFVGCFALYMMGLIGGGDAKFIPVAALWCYDLSLTLFFTYMSVVGGILVLIYLKQEFLVEPLRNGLKELLAKILKFDFYQSFYQEEKENPLYTKYVPEEELPNEDVRKLLIRQEAIDASEKRATYIPYGIAIFWGAWIAVHFSS